MDKYRYANVGCKKCGELHRVDRKYRVQDNFTCMTCSQYVGDVKVRRWPREFLKAWAGEALESNGMTKASLYISPEGVMKKATLVIPKPE